MRYEGILFLLSKTHYKVNLQERQMKSYQFAKVAVMGFPTKSDIENRFIFGDVAHLINVSGHEYPKDIQTALQEHGISVYYLPLVEEGPDMGFENILKAVDILKNADRNNEKAIVHCTCGNNRSRTVVEAFYYSQTGEHLRDEYKGELNHIIYNSANGHLPKQWDWLHRYI